MESISSRTVRNISKRRESSPHIFAARDILSASPYTRNVLSGNLYETCEQLAMNFIRAVNGEIPYFSAAALNLSLKHRGGRQRVPHFQELLR